MTREVMTSESQDSTPAAEGFFMPAEWSPHSATWLTWPASDDFPGKLDAVCWVYTEIIRLLHRVERVRLIVQDAAVEAECRARLLSTGVDCSRVDFVRVRTDRTWARDNLPLFLKHRSNSALLGAAKFRFTGWGRYDDHELDEAAGAFVASSHASRVFLPRRGASPRADRVVLEGGAIDVDGEGTLLTTRACLLGSTFPRNPGATQQELETILRESLGVATVIWLDDGVAGDDTSGHVDDFARFVAPGVVVCAVEKEPADPNYSPLQDALAALRQARDAAGRQLEVISLPMPGPVFFDGERLPASYANFYIANDLVLVPTFNDAADREALGILAELFADRQVVGVHARELVLGLGTLHCSTQQEPAVG